MSGDLRREEDPFFNGYLVPGLLEEEWVDTGQQWGLCDNELCSLLGAVLAMKGCF